MKAIKDLNKQLVSKKSGSYYMYEVNNKRYSINEFNNNKGWCLNEYKFIPQYNEWTLVDSYGYNGLTLKECKQMIVNSWNETVNK